MPGVCVTAVEYGSDGNWLLVLGDVPLTIAVPAEVAASFKKLLDQREPPSPPVPAPIPPVVE